MCFPIILRRSFPFHQRTVLQWITFIFSSKFKCVRTHASHGCWYLDFISSRNTFQIVEGQQFFLLLSPGTSKRKSATWIVIVAPLFSSYSRIKEELWGVHPVKVEMADATLNARSKSNLKVNVKHKIIWFWAGNTNFGRAESRCKGNFTKLRKLWQLLFGLVKYCNLFGCMASTGGRV